MLAGHPKILSCIEADQEAVGKAKKKVRQADQRWQATQTLPLGLCVGEPVATDELTLGQGRPRMKPELVCVFLVLRGYLGSIGDQEARDRLLDSTTVQLYLLRRGEVMPGWTTILENVNAVSNATRNLILDAQLALILAEGLDDFSQVLLDSTAVKANSAWPTDARILLGLLERAFVGSQKLEDFGLSNIPVWWVPRWLKRLSQLLFKINNATGKPRSKSKRKKGRARGGNRLQAAAGPFRPGVCAGALGARGQRRGQHPVGAPGAADPRAHRGHAPRRGH